MLKSLKRLSNYPMVITWSDSRLVWFDRVRVSFRKRFFDFGVSFVNAKSDRSLTIANNWCAVRIIVPYIIAIYRESTVLWLVHLSHAYSLANMARTMVKHIDRPILIPFHNAMINLFPGTKSVLSTIAPVPVLHCSWTRWVWRIEQELLRSCLRCRKRHSV